MDKGIDKGEIATLLLVFVAPVLVRGFVLPDVSARTPGADLVRLVVLVGWLALLARFAHQDENPRPISWRVWLWVPPFALAVGYAMLARLLNPSVVRMQSLPEALSFGRITPVGALLAVAADAIGAGFEELFFRGYLLSRLTQWIGAAWSAVVVVAALQTIAHAPQGTHEVSRILMMSLLHGAVYVRAGRVGPLVLASALGAVLLLVL